MEMKRRRLIQKETIMRISWRKGAEKSVKGYLAVCLMKMDDYKLMQLTERQQNARTNPELQSKQNKRKKKEKKENWQQPQRESLEPQ